MAQKSDNFNADEILKDILKMSVPDQSSLKDLFDRRIEELKISYSTAEEIMKIQHRTLNGILDGTQKTVDFVNLIKLANFLQISKDRTIKLFLTSLEKNFPEAGENTSREVEFIKNNFDLAALRNAGFIDSISDFETIEKKIVDYFGFSRIFEYRRPVVDVAYSQGQVQPKNNLTRDFFIFSAQRTFKELSNPYKYDREGLINFFPEIRWHSTNVEFGLINVIKELYRLGITVIYLSSLSSLHLRGATLAVDKKPSVVLTDYKGFYPTLWFALVHELFHVLFDWEEISTDRYHLSPEGSEEVKVIEKEAEADSFAREYLFSKDKTAKIRPYLNHNPAYVSEFAKINHVHPSFAYVFNAYDAGHRPAWAIAKKQNPNFDNLKSLLDNPLNSPKPITEHIKSLKQKIYF